ncbi:NAD(P)H-binding protein [Marinobacter nauticus]|uniref:NAD(P)H-binding protein n=1 Tax=Marinobacter nauticus TaxID=2743 RepID=UPI000EB3C6C1|nr:NAD(P)H-binding protein [Marinobacter nauticus]RKR77801.1 putative NAD(P)-binding protein [Marinobacter nauticus]
MKVMVLGATGLTGGMVVEKLLEQAEISTVIAPVRRPMVVENPKLEQRFMDFDAMEEQADAFQVDAFICCLGTTLKKAGSKEVFRKVDHDYSLRAAQLARNAGARVMILMSAIGASSSSPVFYNRVKGELEDKVRAMEFPYLVIYHPSLLLGDRSEERTAESLGMAVMPVANHALIGPLRKYRAIEAEAVAEAMVHDLVSCAVSAGPEKTVKVREYDDIRRLRGLQ